MINLIGQIMSDNNIDIFGITSVTNFSFLKERFSIKSENDFLAEFDSAEFEFRSILEKTYPEAKSVISIIFPYPHFREDIKEKEILYDYKISEYACIPDYHTVIKSVLSAVSEKFSSLFPKFYFKPLVDSNPLFEKEIAKLCGTGSFGKNSLIYNKKYGSYIFLSEIVTNMVLPEIYADSIPEMLCSSCNKCIDSCPNKAIESPYMINAKRCISYYTSTKEMFPPELLNGYLWGCDICQSSCPVNRNSISPPKESLCLLPFKSLEEIIFSSNKQLSEFYKDFPIGWSGMSVVRRNALYLLYMKNREKAYESITKILNGNFPDSIKKYAENLKKLY